MTTLHSEKHIPDEKHKLVFVFSGQGSQWPNMGNQLLSQEAIFRTCLEECEEAMRPYIDWSLLEQLTAPESRSHMEEVAYLQPMLFALQVALARLWISLGICPNIVVGYSMGEIAAAHIAGVLSLSDAARIICLRSLLLQPLSGQGAMALVELSLEQARQAILGKEAWVSVAVSNSPVATVLSGNPQVLRELLTTFEEQKISWRPIKAYGAGHSPQMDPLLEEVRACLHGIKPQKASLPFYSTVTTKVVEGPECDETYWVRNLREPVLFSPVVQHLVAEDKPLFLEISPHPLLLSAIQQCVPEELRPVIALPSLRRDEDEHAVLLSTLRALVSILNRS
jgi:myxalamid-type polyketide synthase MxaE and MxaD